MKEDPAQSGKTLWRVVRFYEYLSALGGLSGVEWQVLVRLCSLVGVGGKPYAHPSFEQLAADLGVSSRAVKKAVKSMVRKGVLTVRVGGGRARANEYVPAFALVPDGSPYTAARGAETVNDRSPFTAAERVNDSSLFTAERVNDRSLFRGGKGEQRGQETVNDRSPRIDSYGSKKDSAALRTAPSGASAPACAPAHTRVRARASASNESDPTKAEHVRFIGAWDKRSKSPAGFALHETAAAWAAHARLIDLENEYDIQDPVYAWLGRVRDQIDEAIAKTQRLVVIKPRRLLELRVTDRKIQIRRWLQPLSPAQRAEAEEQLREAAGFRNVGGFRRWVKTSVEDISPAARWTRIASIVAADPPSGGAVQNGAETEPA